MDPRYAQVEEEYHALQKRLADPALSHGSEAYQRAAREFKRLEPIVQKIETRRRLADELKNLQSLKESPEREMRELALSEGEALLARLAETDRELDEALTPRDPEDGRDVIMEIRAGTGGDEAALFAGDLFRMYGRYAAEKGFAVELYSSHPTGRGGFKEVVFGVKGQDVFRHFKFERGVHRVQRIPVTEASGRIHTSTATVAVLPEMDEVEVEINPADLRIDTYRASGAGGQHVNRTDSAVRITHLPTGVVVACQDERSQIKNRAKAMSLLRARLYQQRLEQAATERRDLRRSQVGTGERSEKIRTYNFPQDRITDHRINQNFHSLPAVMEGQMDAIVKACWAWERDQKAAESGKAGVPR